MVVTVWVDVEGGEYTAGDFLSDHLAVLNNFIISSPSLVPIRVSFFPQNSRLSSQSAQITSSSPACYLHPSGAPPNTIPQHQFSAILMENMVSTPSPMAQHSVRRYAMTRANAIFFGRIATSHHHLVPHFLIDPSMIPRHKT